VEVAPLLCTTAAPRPDAAPPPSFRAAYRAPRCSLAAARPPQQGTLRGDAARGAPTWGLGRRMRGGTLRCSTKTTPTASRCRRAPPPPLTRERYVMNITLTVCVCVCVCVCGCVCERERERERERMDVAECVPAAACPAAASQGGVPLQELEPLVGPSAEERRAAEVFPGHLRCIPPAGFD